MLALSIIHQNFQSKLWKYLNLASQTSPKKCLNAKESFGFLLAIMP